MTRLTDILSKLTNSFNSTSNSAHKQPAVHKRPAGLFSGIQTGGLFLNQLQREGVLGRMTHAFVLSSNVYRPELLTTTGAQVVLERF